MSTDTPTPLSEGRIRKMASRAEYLQLELNTLRSDFRSPERLQANIQTVKERIARDLALVAAWEERARNLPQLIAEKREEVNLAHKAMTSAESYDLHAQYGALMETIATSRLDLEGTVLLNAIDEQRIESIDAASIAQLVSEFESNQ